MTRPLQDRTVVLTRMHEDAASLSRGLSELGADVVVIPTIAVRPVHNPSETEAILATVDQFGWMAFASGHGVRCVAQIFTSDAQQRWHKAARRPRLAAVGPGTAQVLSALLGAPDVVATRADAEGLSDTLRRVARPNDGVVLLPKAAAGRDVLEHDLQAAGFTVRCWVVYDTLPTCAEDGPLPLPPQVDFVVFTSPSTVRGFVARGALPQGAVAVSMGPTTSAALRQAGVVVGREAVSHTVEGLIEVLKHE